MQPLCGSLLGGGLDAPLGEVSAWCWLPWWQLRAKRRQQVGIGGSSEPPPQGFTLWQADSWNRQDDTDISNTWLICDIYTSRERKKSKPGTTVQKFSYLHTQGRQPLFSTPASLFSLTPWSWVRSLLYPSRLARKKEPTPQGRESHAGN